MFAFDRAPLRARCTAFKPVLAISAAFLLAGCSSAKQPSGPQVFAWLQPEPPPPAPYVSAEVEMEDDGMPAQAPPYAANRQMSDDPAAPWSRNYGRATVGWPVEAAPLAGKPAVGSREALGALNDGTAMASADEGLPIPKSPEEAGVTLDTGRTAFPCFGWQCRR